MKNDDNSNQSGSPSEQGKQDINSDEASIPSPDAKPTLLQSISSNGVLLGLFALISTAIIAGTQLSTADKIAEQKRQAQLKALYQIIPRERHDNDLLESSIGLQSTELGLRVEKKLFLATKNAQPITLIYPVTAREGYSGDIDFVIGINVSDASIAGVRVLSHKETPGLGDKVDLRKSNWILAFNGRSLGNPDFEQWTVKKDGGDFDGFTGATITPRAVIKSIASALKYHHQNQEVLLKQFLSVQKKLQSNSASTSSNPTLTTSR